MDAQQQENPYAAPDSADDPFDTPRKPRSSWLDRAMVVLIGVFVTIGVFVAFCFGAFGVLELTGIYSAMGGGFQFAICAVVVVAGLVCACGCAGWCVEKHVTSRFRRRRDFGKATDKR